MGVRSYRIGVVAEKMLPLVLWAHEHKLTNPKNYVCIPSKGWLLYSTRHNSSTHTHAQLHKYSGEKGNERSGVGLVMAEWRRCWRRSRLTGAWGRAADIDPRRDACSGAASLGQRQCHRRRNVYPCALSLSIFEERVFRRQSIAGNDYMKKITYKINAYSIIHSYRYKK